jgi:hypothetical protein
MDSNTTAFDAELEAMRVIGTALANLDPGARVRVLNWIGSHFAIGTPPTQMPPAHGLQMVGGTTEVETEIPGIARLTDAGLEITVRDLKAKSALDAAIRLAHVVLLAKEKLTGAKTVSSRKELVPILKQWRLYDGNTRLALGQHKGILRKGDDLSLDAISRRDAEMFIQQVLDDSVLGSWNPNGRPRKPIKKSGRDKAAVADTE